MLVRQSMACPALPLCGLAQTEAERIMPDIAARLRASARAVGLPDGATWTTRVTGCPNGCARPYAAELALVGQGPEQYQVWVGGSPVGTRIASVLTDKMKLSDLEATVGPLLAAWKNERDGPTEVRHVATFSRLSSIAPTPFCRDAMQRAAAAAPAGVRRPPPSSATHPRAPSAACRPPASRRPPRLSRAGLWRLCAPRGRGAPLRVGGQARAGAAERLGALAAAALRAGSGGYAMPRWWGVGGNLARARLGAGPPGRQGRRGLDGARFASSGRRARHAFCARGLAGGQR